MKGTDPTLARALALATDKLGPVLGPVVVEVALAIVDARAAKPADDADPWIPHDRWTFCTSRRAACDLARSGAIDGARLVGEGRARRWIARRSALEAYVEAHGRPVAERDVKPANDGADDVGDIMAELGFERAPQAAPRAARGARR